MQGAKLFIIGKFFASIASRWFEILIYVACFAKLRVLILRVYVLQVFMAFTF